MRATLPCRRGVTDGCVCSATFRQHVRRLCYHVQSGQPRDIVPSSANPLSGQARIEVTMDDPTGTFPNPQSSPSLPGQPSSNAFVSVFPASAVGGPAGSPLSQIGAITPPITDQCLANLCSAPSRRASSKPDLGSPGRAHFAQN